MGRKTHTIEPDDFQKQVCIGSLPGDSSIPHQYQGYNKNLSCYHAIKQLDWLTQRHDWLNPISRPIKHCKCLDKRNGKFYYGARFHTITLPWLTELSKILYVGGRKSVLPEYIEQMKHPVAIACLIGDDGSWNKSGVSIATKAFTCDENELIASHLGRAFGIKAAVKNRDKYPTVEIHATSIAHLRTIVLPWLPERLHYKLGPAEWKTSLVGKIETECHSCRRVFSAYETSMQRFCSKQCAAPFRRNGYATRTRKIACERCGGEFTPYNRRVLGCVSCRDLRITPSQCVVCGSPVYKQKSVTCSRACNVKLGHRHRIPA